MRLSLLLRALNIAYGGEDREITYITDDSRKCKDGCIFVCHKCGTDFLKEALENGAAAVVSEENVCENCYVVPNTREAYNVLCREYFSSPDRKLKMIAVTGTNGKTSVSTMIAYILEMSGRKTGLIGTVFNKYGDTQNAEMTTPDCFELFRMLGEMVKHGFEYCVIEASSQGLSQKRLFAITFETAVFTNLTEDHLDYHKTFENYKNAKLSLFENCKTAVINYDDKYKDEFIAACKGRIITYSSKSDEADFTARGIRYNDDITSYELVSDSLIHRISLKAKGDFWVANSMAAVVCAYESGLTVESCAFSLKTFTGVKGRMELLDTATDYRVMIDYAHTADGLCAALTSLRRYCKGRLILVFGCGGDREVKKRSEMGKIAVTYSDIVFVTSDNPRTEDPQKIIDDILVGIKKGRTPVYIEKDRKKAIFAAMKTARKNDIILLAGKGHEEYQIIGKEKIVFDERQIIKEYLNN